MRRCCDRSCSSDMRRTKQIEQEEYEKVYIGPEFDLSVRYASAVSLVLLVLMYSAGMPVLYFCLPVFFGVCFALDRCLCSFGHQRVVVRFFKIPPQYDEKLSGMARFLYQLGVLIHFAIGFWMFSNRDIVPNEAKFNDTSVITDVFDDKLPFGDRASSFQSLIMLFGLLLMAAIYVLYYLFSAFFCCSKVQRHNGCDKNLIECLSYEQLLEEYIETKKQLELLREKYGKLKQKLAKKLEKLGDEIKKFFKTHGKEDLTKVDSKELTEETLNEFFRNNKVKSVASSIQGLASYNLMVSHCMNIVQS